MFISELYSDKKKTNFALQLVRKQVPLRLCCGMSINKIQGQTIKEKLGFYLSKAVFSHGQYYVALSRVGSPDKIKVLIKDTHTQGRLDKRKKKIYILKTLYTVECSERWYAKLRNCKGNCKTFMYNPLLCLTKYLSIFQWF